MTSSLSKQQIDELRQQLQRRLQQLKDEVHEELLKTDEEQYIEIAGLVHDSEEASVADLLADMNLAMVDMHINRMREVEAALARIDQGSYGACIDCGDDIDHQRLRAQPMAERCYDCQSRHERSYTQEGHPTL